MLHFGNVITAMITPMHEDQSVNYEGAVKLAKYLAEHGSDGILVAGTTGEGTTLTTDERQKLFTNVVKTVGDKVLVVANVGTNNTAQTVEFAKLAETTGVDALLVIVPYYNKPNQDGCYAHFAAVAEATKLPILIYNVPGRTGGRILPETVIKLANAYPNIVGIKEASGNLEAAAVIARDTPDHFYVYSGDDALTLPILAVGGQGVISVASHLIGNEMNALVQSYKDGNVKKAKELHHKYLPVMTGLFYTVNPTPVKACCNILGLPAGPFRLPMVDATPEKKEFLKAMMKDAGVL